MRSRTASSASRACSRGIAYSISTKRSSRVLMRMRSLRSIELVPTRRCSPTIAARRGDQLGRARARPPRSAPKKYVREEDLGPPALVRALRRGGSSVRLLHSSEHVSVCGQPVELEVVVAPSTRSSSSASTSCERRRLLDVAERERRHALQRDLGDDAERAEPDPCAVEHLGLLVGRARAARSPSAVTSSSAADERREPAEPRRRCRACRSTMAPAMVWRSMSPRFGSAEPALRELLVEPPDRDARPRP